MPNFKFNSCCGRFPSLTHMSRGSTGFPAATYLQEHPYSSRSRGQRPVAQRSFRAKFSSEGKLSKTEWSQVKRRPRQSARRGGRQDGNWRRTNPSSNSIPCILQEQTDVIIDNPVSRAQRSRQGWKWFRRQLSTWQMSPQCCSALSVSENFTACEGVDINNIRKWHNKSGGVEAAGRWLDEPLLQISKWNSKRVVLTSKHTLTC